MGKTKYYCADSIGQAIEYLNTFNGQAMLLAGGTDIMVLQNQYSLPEDTVFIGIENISEMKGISLDGNKIHIGALVTTQELADDAMIKEKMYALHLAAKESASPQVRNRATIGGNVATASPSGDLLTVLVACDADMVVAGSEGEKIIKVADALVSAKKTALSETDVIKEFIVAVSEENEDSAFEKIGKRKAMTISIVNVAAKVKLSSDGTCIEKVSVSAGACAATVKRLTRLEEALAGCKAEEEEIEKLAKKALEDVSPITDLRATKWYRQEVLPVLVKRVIMAAVTKIREA